MRLLRLGGFITQSDPIGIAGGLNLYGYAGGDPVNFSDPFGLCVDEDEAEEGDACRWLVSELRKLDGGEFQDAAQVLDDLTIPVFLGVPGVHPDLQSTMADRVRGRTVKAPVAECAPGGDCVRPDLRITLDMTQAVGDFLLTAVHETYHLNARDWLNDAQIRPHDIAAFGQLPPYLQGLAPYYRRTRFGR